MVWQFARSRRFVRFQPSTAFSMRLSCFCTWQGLSLLRANGLGISGGAPVDREGGWTASTLQNSYDLVGAKRRPLHALVGRNGRNRFTVRFIITLSVAVKCFTSVMYLYEDRS